MIYERHLRQSEVFRSLWDRKAGKSKYTINLSFDLPMENNRISIKEPLKGEFTILPASDKKSAKGFVYSGKNTIEIESKKLTTKADSYCNRSAREYKSSLQKPVNRSHQNSMVNSRMFVPSHGRSFSYGAKRVSKEVPEKFFRETEDDLIGYTTSSVDLDRQSQMRMQ